MRLEILKEMLDKADRLCKTQHEYERFRRDYTAKARTIYRRTKKYGRADRRKAGGDG